MSCQVEIKLKKSEGVQWKKLESVPQEEAEILPVAAGLYVCSKGNFDIQSVCFKYMFLRNVKSQFDSKLFVEIK